MGIKPDQTWIDGDIIRNKYLDTNNLYSHSMSQKLPTHSFKWMTKSMLNNWKKHLCILEVDLSYPVELHNLHNEYPIAPKKFIINKTEKRISNLSNKTTCCPSSNIKTI